ncbi:MAG: response regulator [Acidobacteria bacterium]|nr:response regulator [Acidobacteriota bacterium]
MSKQRAKVLVIEQDAAATGSIAGMATTHAGAFDFEYVDRISAGLARLDNDEIDMVLLDLALPGVGSVEGVATFIQAQHRDAALPVVVLTENADDAFCHGALKVGARQCLDKTELDADVLQDALQQVLQTKGINFISKSRSNGVSKPVNGNGNGHHVSQPSKAPTGAATAVAAKPAPVVHPLTRKPVAIPAPLAQAEEVQYRALLDCARDGIIQIGLNDHVSLWSKGAERIYGWTEKDALDQPLHQLLHPEGSAKYAQGRDAAEKHGEWSGETRQRTKDGREITVESRWTLVRNEAGAPSSLLVINTDITDRKRIEAHLLRAQRMDSIGALAAGIAHDLNNVLAPILMALPMLEKLVEDDLGRRWISLIQKSAERGKGLIGQVLTFAKGTTGEQAPLQLTLLIKDAVRILKETLPRSIEIEIALDDDPPYVIGDMTQLHQMLMNFCLNARDAMPQGGKLKLELEDVQLSENDLLTQAGAVPGRFIRLTVADTGTGIPTDILDRIFDPFFTTKEHGKGTGLGLSIAMGIARSHGGFIDVQSEINKGTQFKIYLPASAAAAEAKAEDEAVAAAAGHGELILVVDDEANIREVVEATLQAHGYQVITAEDGQEALEIYAERQSEIRVVLTDLMMPKMDGVTAIRKMRDLNPNVQIIVTTGVKLSGQHAEANKLGFGVFLAKPYTVEQLLGTLESVLR